MLRLTSFIASLPSYFSPATLDESTGLHPLFDDTEDLDDDAFEDDPLTTPNAHSATYATNAQLESQAQQQKITSVTSINLPASPASSLTSSSSFCSSPFSCPNCHKNVQVSQKVATTSPPLHQLTSNCRCTSQHASSLTSPTRASASLELTPASATATATTTTKTIQLRHSSTRNSMQLTNASRRRFASASFPSASSSSSSCEGKETFNCETSQIRRRSADDIAYFKEIGSYLRRVSEEFDRSSRSNLTNKFAITLTSISPSNSRSF